MTAVPNRRDTIGTAIESVKEQGCGPVGGVSPNGGSARSTEAMVELTKAEGATVIREPDDGIHAR